ncbi:hypothetical protein [Pollutibacter soli]|uniref:heavy-metal-associated domain-containing protein n=1 Tax=Pollutibacter soli TaxID=3034157 RepID=UPI003013B768
MKSQFKFFSLTIVLFFSLSAIAQKKVTTDSIKVWGNCGMCKKTIETAAKSAGADSANWSTETHMLTVSYKSKKSKNQDIQKAVAAAGYDTQDFTAPDDAYNKLHSCCQYDRKADTVATDNAQLKSATSMDCSDCCKDGKCTKDKECCKDEAACKAKGCAKS